MALQLFNTLSRSKDLFQPLAPGRVGLYVCGPTVYDFAHIGNARPVVVFDVLFRLLRRLYPEVVYVRNITDIDDKIIRAAAENGEPIEALTARTEETDKIVGLTVGADDYMTKPFSPRELVARVRALLRRVHREKTVGAVQGYGPIVVDADRHTVEAGGTPVALTAKEFDLLAMLEIVLKHGVSRRGHWNLFNHFSVLLERGA